MDRVPRRRTLHGLLQKILDELAMRRQPPPPPAGTIHLREPRKR